jgi:hypothetical protein
MRTALQAFLVACVFITWTVACLPLGTLLRNGIGGMQENVTTWVKVNNILVVHIPFTPLPTDIFAAVFSGLLLTALTFLLCDTKKIFTR